MKLVIISDTHNRHQKVPKIDCDVLIHAGDLTMSGYLNELRDVADWFKDYPAKHKVSIAGNHDFCFENNKRADAKQVMTDAGVVYLQDDWVLLDNLKIFGSPYTPWFYNWAFNAQRGPDIRQHWDKIPDDTDVLITHGPPHGILDKVSGGTAGCSDLLDKVLKVKPKIHAFGHLHQGAGFKEFNGTIFVNATVVDESYKVCYDPFVIDI